MKLYHVELDDDDWGEGHYVIANSFDEAETKALLYVKEHPKEDDNSILDDEGNLKKPKEKKGNKVVMISLLTETIIK